MEGIPGAPGFAIGKARILNKININEIIPKKPHNESGVEINRYQKGLDLCKEYFGTQVYKQDAQYSGDEMEIFEGYIEILDDEDINEEIKELIEGENHSAESAVQQIYKQTEEDFRNMENEYFAARAQDIAGLREKLIMAINMGEVDQKIQLTQDTIIVADDLSPADTAQLDVKKLAGFIMEKGSSTSHVAIIARSIQLPCVVGVNDILNSVKDNDQIIIDGMAGKVLVNPSNEILKEYQQRKIQYQAKQKELLKIVTLPSLTKDQHNTKLAMNANTLFEVKGGKEFNPDGIGLFRTEFLFMEEKHFPSLDRQFDFYKKVVTIMKGEECVFRLLDIGGDKPLPYAPFPDEMNPFLGWRAIRYCFDHESILIDQLTALIKASHFGKVSILVPMVSYLEEVKKIKSYIKDIKSELQKKEIPYSNHIPIGVMIETPAAVAIATDLAKEVDFFSIGTNDLVQYTLAVDRGNPKVASLYQELHPAVLRFVFETVKAAKAAGIWTGICGELASKPEATPLLVGLGIDELSMNASAIPAVKKILRQINYSEVKKFSLSVIEKNCVQDIRKTIEQFIAQNNLEY
ncbi:MAG: phosphoenolpyruvate--protein phosphotransferase [Spirochaetes bacterium]|nr:phosphoenolpyruvate--protein phosphotransferase [Spirochaetota bacterium]